MIFVMAIGSEVFGRFVGEIDVSVEVEYGGVLLCVSGVLFRFIWASKGAQNLFLWCQVRGSFWCFGSD